jgi:hypothetical protein
MKFMGPGNVHLGQALQVIVIIARCEGTEGEEIYEDRD